MLRHGVLLTLQLGSPASLGELQKSQETLISLEISQPGRAALLISGHNFVVLAGSQGASTGGFTLGKTFTGEIEFENMLLWLNNG